MKPITSKRFKIEFSASETLAKKIQRAKEILRHKYPHGRLEDILDEALELLLEKKDPERKIKCHFEQNEVSHKKNETSLAMSRSFYDTRKTRYVPVKTKQTIWDRDKGQCSYVSPEGKQCGERNFLELDHIKPFALGGDSTAENVRLLCRSHNQWRAEKTFGSSLYSSHIP